MKKAVSALLSVLLLLSLASVSFAEASTGSEGTLQAQSGSDPEAGWDFSVPTEITEDVQALFDQALEGLLGVNYTPVAVLGQNGETWCILARASVVYPDAKPYNVLVYLREQDGTAQLQNIYELWIGAHSEKLSAAEIELDYGSSALYSAEDMDAAVAVIRAKFDTWEGCELHRVSYAGDECSSAENLAWMRSLGDTQAYSQCIEFTSEFHSPKEAYGAWEADKEYTGWQWWLARSDGGDWELLTWGY